MAGNALDERECLLGCTVSRSGAAVSRSAQSCSGFISRSGGRRRTVKSIIVPATSATAAAAGAGLGTRVGRATACLLVASGTSGHVESREGGSARHVGHAHAAKFRHTAFLDVKCK